MNNFAFPIVINSNLNHKIVKSLPLKNTKVIFNGAPPKLFAFVTKITPLDNIKDIPDSGSPAPTKPLVPVIKSNSFYFNLGGSGKIITSDGENFWKDFASNALNSGASILEINIDINIGIMPGPSETRANIESAENFIKHSLPELLKKENINIPVRGRVNQKTKTDSGKHEISVFPLN